MCLSVAIDRPADVLASGKHAGHEWMIVHNRLGYRCGYVKVEAGHPWHGKGYDDVPAEVHGGLTFAHPDKPCDGAAPDTGWWFGFDCGHGGDAKDPALLTADQRAWEEKFSRDFLTKYPEYRGIETGDVVRSQEYVESECRSLCEQAASAVTDSAPAR